MREMNVFTGLMDAELMRLAIRGHEERREKGVFLLHQGAPAPETLMLILEGEVALVLDGAQGKRTRLLYLQAGDFVQAGWAFTEESSLCHAIAMSRVRLLRLPKSLWFDLGAKNPVVFTNLAEVMHRRLCEAYGRIAGLSRKRAPARLARVLVEMAQERGLRLRDAEGKMSVLIAKRPSQEILGELAGAVRESVSRLIAKWCREGWLEDKHGDLRILDMAKLERMAEG